MSQSIAGRAVHFLHGPYHGRLRNVSMLRAGSLESGVRKRLAAMIPALLPTLERHRWLKPTCAERVLPVAVSHPAPSAKMAMSFLISTSVRHPVRDVAHDKFAAGAAAWCQAQRRVGTRNLG
jgi:hypothetical protein